MRRRIAALGCLLALAAGGCAPRPEEPEGGYCVYYSALSDRFAPLPLDCEPFEGSGGDPIPALVDALLSPPETQGLATPFPEGVRLLSWELEEGRLHLDLSEQYGGLSGVDLTVADACLTLTLCQVEGVESVYVTVEGREIPYRRVQQLGPDGLLLTDGTDVPPEEPEPVSQPEQPVPAAEEPPAPVQEHPADPVLTKPRSVAQQGTNPFPYWGQIVQKLEGIDPMLYMYLRKSKAYFDGTRVLIDGGKTFRDFIRVNKDSQKLIKKLIAEVSGVPVPIGPYEPKTAGKTASNAEQSLLALEKLGLEVSIEDTARKKR